MGVVCAVLVAHELDVGTITIIGHVARHAEGLQEGHLVGRRGVLAGFFYFTQDGDIKVELSDGDQRVGEVLFQPLFEIRAELGHGHPFDKEAAEHGKHDIAVVIHGVALRGGLGRLGIGDHVRRGGLVHGVEVERADGIFIEGGDFNIQQITGLEAGAFEDGLLNLLVGHVAAVFHIDHVLLWFAGCYGEEQQQDTEEIGMFFHQKVNSRKGRKKNGLGKGGGLRGARCGVQGVASGRWWVVRGEKRRGVGSG